MDWIARFQAAVRSGDPVAGLPLFSPGTASFGTRTNFASSSRELLEKQWSQIWARSHDFELHILKEVMLGPEHRLILCHFVNHTEINGRETERHGRATFILEKLQNDWLCIHSHFSEMV